MWILRIQRRSVYRHIGTTILGGLESHFESTELGTMKSFVWRWAMNSTRFGGSRTLSALRKMDSGQHPAETFPRMAISLCLPRIGKTRWAQAETAGTEPMSSSWSLSKFRVGYSQPVAAWVIPRTRIVSVGLASWERSLIGTCIYEHAR